MSETSSHNSTIPYSNINETVNPSNTRSPCRTRALKSLALIQLVCSILILVLGCIATGLGNNDNRHYYMGCCYGGTAIWGGIMLVVASSFGVAHMWHKCNKCIRVAYFVLAIIAAVVSAVICIMYGVYSGIFNLDYSYSYNESYYDYDPEQIYNAVLGIMICVCLLAGLNLLCFIVATSFWCYNWCDCCGAKESAQVLVAQYSMARSSQLYGNATAPVTNNQFAGQKHRGDSPPPYEEA